MTTFLDLPIEIRTMIYKTHLETLNLDWPGNYNCQPRLKRDRPSTDNVAILRSCRTVHEDLKDNWLDTVMLRFATVRQLLDALAPLPLATRQKVRKISVDEPEAKIIFVHRQKVTLMKAFNLLPGLHLNLLVIDCLGQLSRRLLSSHESRSLLHDLSRLQYGPFRRLEVRCRLDTFHWSYGHYGWISDPPSSPFEVVGRLKRAIDRAESECLRGLLKGADVNDTSLVQSAAKDAGVMMHKQTRLRLFRAIPPAHNDAVWDAGMRQEITEDGDGKPTSGFTGSHSSSLQFQQFSCLLTMDRKLSAPAKQATRRDELDAKVWRRFNKYNKPLRDRSSPLTWRVVKETESEWHRVMRRSKFKARKKDLSKAA